MQNLSAGLAKKLKTLGLQRDACVRLLEKTTRVTVRGDYMRSIVQLTAEIESHQQALEYNKWLDDELARGPWVEVVVTNVEDHDPMDGVYIEIVDEDPDKSGIEVEFVALPRERLETAKTGVYEYAAEPARL